MRARHQPSSRLGFARRDFGQAGHEGRLAEALAKAVGRI
jgi:hypothetical protein